ncbi:MAG: hypothetical protein JWN86_2396 [Planctomycetota bacterium]|nr:hypothetical protein [Planctomycetota bacterium]
MNEVRDGGKPAGTEVRSSVPISGNRQQAIGAVRLWAGITLSLTVTLAAFAIWHLVRRGRLLRVRVTPVKAVRPLEAPEPEVSGPS